MPKHTITTIRDLLEADRGERDLERAGDPEAFFKLAMKRLRRQRHLGQMRLQDWQALIAGADIHRHKVYLATPLGSYYTPGILVQMFDKFQFLGGIGADETIIRMSKMGHYTVTKWTSHLISRPYLNNSLTPNSRLTASSKDFTKYAVGDGAPYPDVLVKELGLEDMF